MYAQVVLFDKFDPLDVIAPFEVLVAGAQALGGGLTVELVSAEGPREVVSGTQDMTLTATAALDPAKPGYVVVPGASGPVNGDPDQGVETIPVLLARAAQTALIPLIGKALANPEITVATVCGGSLVLAMGGLIDNRYATTHYMGMDVLDATGVNAVNARVVDDGDLISGGGVTSGLDLGLYLLERSYGPRIAHAVEKLFEYERRGTAWKPSAIEPQEL
ncbi:DJ-1/PfpI family protein [Mycolicibacterium smegmatis]|uniref:DJ-1/PfpI family protein n=1 Tax=Mycolicibacterium smegmatis TaxID=1772 RepID=UPI001E55EC2E|nr:DJ-1/PfpI family protein [Mycolicibacterium smegmatis]UGU29396.1 DJ-1/PfpI family protein [Mycolicibacterium smegmatis]ULN70357.1 DJ-1/PfpI family protein [Mycolicibacterium smegmatis]